MCSHLCRNFWFKANVQFTLLLTRKGDDDVSKMLPHNEYINILTIDNNFQCLNSLRMHLRTSVKLYPHQKKMERKRFTHHLGFIFGTHHLICCTKKIEIREYSSQLPHCRLHSGYVQYLSIRSWSVPTWLQRSAKFLDEALFLLNDYTTGLAAVNKEQLLFSAFLQNEMVIQ